MNRIDPQAVALPEVADRLSDDSLLNWSSSKRRRGRMDPFRLSRTSDEAGARPSALLGGLMVDKLFDKL